jgi:hypothetical protein
VTHLDSLFIYWDYLIRFESLSSLCPNDAYEQ